MEFSVRNSFLFGWHKTREHSGLLFSVLLTGFAVQVTYSIVGEVLKGTVLGFLASAALLVLSVIFGVGLISIALKLTRGERAVYRDIVPPASVVWRVLLASLLVAVLTLGGLILFIIPGVWIMLRYFMVRFSALESKGVMESLHKSVELTQGVKWHLLRFLLAIVALNLLGALLFLVGLLITIPVTVLAYAHIYEKLLHRLPTARP